MPSNLLHAALPDPATMIAAIREERNYVDSALILSNDGLGFAAATSRPEGGVGEVFGSVEKSVLPIGRSMLSARRSAAKAVSSSPAGRRAAKSGK